MEIDLKHYRTAIRGVKRVKCPDGLFSVSESVIPTLYREGYKFFSEDYGYSLFCKKPFDVAKEQILTFSKLFNIEAEKYKFVYYPIYGGEKQDMLYIFYKEKV